MNQTDQSLTPIPVFTDDRGARGDDPFNLNKLTALPRLRGQPGS